MTTPELLTIAALALSGVNTILLTLTYRRAERWKEGEDAKHLIGRVVLCEQKIGSMDSAITTATGLSQRLGVVEGAVAGLNTRMENVSTKADVARVTAILEGQEAHIKRAEAGVERIEGFLMNNGRGHA